MLLPGARLDELHIEYICDRYRQVVCYGLYIVLYPLGVGVVVVICDFYED